VHRGTHPLLKKCRFFFSEMKKCTEFLFLGKGWLVPATQPRHASPSPARPDPTTAADSDHPGRAQCPVVRRVEKARGGEASSAAGWKDGCADGELPLSKPNGPQRGGQHPGHGARVLQQARRPRRRRGRHKSRLRSHRRGSSSSSVDTAACDDLKAWDRDFLGLLSQDPCWTPSTTSSTPTTSESKGSGRPGRHPTEGRRHDQRQDRPAATTANHLLSPSV
jgi:hypothetical protein